MKQVQSGRWLGKAGLAVALAIVLVGVECWGGDIQATPKSEALVDNKEQVSEQSGGPHAILSEMISNDAFTETDIDYFKKSLMQMDQRNGMNKGALAGPDHKLCEKLRDEVARNNFTIVQPVLETTDLKNPELQDYAACHDFDFPKIKSTDKLDRDFHPVFSADEVGQYYIIYKLYQLESCSNCIYKEFLYTEVPKEIYQMDNQPYEGGFMAINKNKCHIDAVFAGVQTNILSKQGASLGAKFFDQKEKVTKFIFKIDNEYYVYEDYFQKNLYNNKLIQINNDVSIYLIKNINHNLICDYHYTRGIAPND